MSLELIRVIKEYQSPFKRVLIGVLNQVETFTTCNQHSHLSYCIVHPREITQIPNYPKTGGEILYHTTEIFFF